MNIEVTLCKECASMLQVCTMLAALESRSICDRCLEALDLGELPLCKECGRLTCDHDEHVRATTWNIYDIYDFFVENDKVKNLDVLREMIRATKDEEDFLRRVRARRRADNERTRGQA